VGWIIFFAVVALIWLIARSGQKAAPAPASRVDRRPAAAERRAYSVPHDHLRQAEVIANNERGRWIPIGETTRVAGLLLEGGMIYVGGTLRKANGQGTDNCLIDPTLRIANENPDLLGATMSYWPAYDAITPRARLAYIQWLADGRRNPSAYIGYVFLFFYGLERRVFVDGTRDELPAIVAEVRRLLDIYGSNGSFNGYARRFLDMAELAATGMEVAPELRPDLRNGFELPLPVRVWLGKRLKSGERLSAEDALMWVLALPDTYPRTAVTRCFNEFRSLWATYFQEAWPQGLNVSAPKTELRVSYQPASGTFDGVISVEGLPDIASVTRPIPALKRLIERCTDELDGYSRLVGRKPEARGGLEAALLLPVGLHASEHAGPLRTVRAELDALVGADGLAAAPTAQVFELMGLDADDGGKPAVLRQTCTLLDAMGVGFEPDRRFGGPNLSDASHLVLFRQSEDGCDPDGAAFAPARVMVEVAALAAAADGEIAPAEFDAIRADLEATTDLTVPERTRLSAYAMALLLNPPKQQAVLGKLAKSPVAERAEIARSALSAVLADGRVTPEEVKFLERLNKALGLPQEDVYSALHRAEVLVDEPMRVAAEVRHGGVPIPAQDNTAELGVTLDAARLSRIRQETTAVSSLLAEIFAEEPVVAVPAHPPVMSAGSAFAGLDAAHSELVAPFAETASCDWATFETRARALRLLPDGALETINEWAFDRFDEPLLEAGEAVIAAAHLQSKLKNLGAVA